MKAQSKSRKNPTCSRCRFHGNRDVRILQHKCPFKNCSCANCQLVKARSVIYRTQKNLDKQDDNKSGGVSSSSNASSGSNGCFESSFSKTILTTNSNESAFLESLNPSSSNSLNTKNFCYSKIRNFQNLCLTFPDYTPSYLQSLFEECDNDFEQTIDKILMSKWYSEQAVTNELNEEQILSQNNFQYYCDNHLSSLNSYPNPHQKLTTSEQYGSQEYFQEPDLNNRENYLDYGSINSTVSNNQWKGEENNLGLARYPLNSQNNWPTNENYSYYPNNSNAWNTTSPCLVQNDEKALELNFDRPFYPKMEYDYEYKDSYEPVNLGQRCNTFKH